MAAWTRAAGIMRPSNAKSAADAKATRLRSFLLGFVSHAMGQGLTSVALVRVAVAKVAVVILAQPPVSALIAWIVLGETMTFLQMAGGGVILTGVYLARPRLRGYRERLMESRA